MIIIIGFLTKTSEQFSRGWILSWYAFGLIGTVAARDFLARRLARWQEQGRFLRRIAVIGTGEQARKVLDWLNIDQKSNYAIAGFSVQKTIPRRRRQRVGKRGWRFRAMSRT